jgi:predicted AlkP superfamily phosphohydrolase/phosphomutase
MQKRFLWSVPMVLLLALLVSCTSGDSPPNPPPAPTAKAPEPPPPVAKGPAENRVVILGFDGVDPDWVERWAADLPNLAALLGGRKLQRLATTTPPQSPVAWSTFATSLNPGAHGIFDFVARDPQSYLPMVGTNDYAPPKLDGGGKLLTKATATSPRQGTPFWKIAADGGKRVRLLFVPYSFPPDPLPADSGMLSGLGVPDLRLTNSTSFVFSSVQPTKSGSGVETVHLDGTAPYRGTIVGPAGASGTRVSIPISFGVSGDSVSVDVGSSHVAMRVGEFSPWTVLTFDVTPSFRASASVRFFAMSVPDASGKGELAVYMTPLMVNPDDPYFDTSSPPAYAQALWKQYGPTKTIGWEADTSALNAELIPDALFLRDMNETMTARLAMALGELEKNDAELFVAVFTETDRVAHMFSRLSDPKSPRYDKKLAAQHGSAIKETYVRMDEAIGKFVAALRPGDRFLLLSDHGFQSFRRGFNTNTWLLDNGYLVLKSGQRTDDDGLLPGKGVGVDWSKTKAYAFGTGQIYLNVKGREGQGIVAASEQTALAREIAAKIVTAKDGAVPVVSTAYVAADTYAGNQLAKRGPDIQLAFVDGWQTSRRTSLGGIPLKQFEDNDKKWSGEHSSSDAKDTQGILVTNEGDLGPDPSIADIAPTALSLLGVAIPPTFEGKVLGKQ